MNFTLEAAVRNERDIFSNMMQYYFYDFSEFNEADIVGDGRFDEYPYLDHYWEEKGRYAFVMKYDDKYAGFALVREIEQEDKRYYLIAEFFVMKKYRRSGLGRLAARQLFKRFSGEWEVSQIRGNQPAKKFWRSVIEEYTNGSWTEMEVESRLIQRFISY